MRQKCKQRFPYTVAKEFYYPAVLVIVQKSTKRVQIFHDIVQLLICILGYCTAENRSHVVPHAQICCTFSVVYNSFPKNVVQTKLDNE